MNIIYTDSPLEYLESVLESTDKVYYYDNVLGWFDFTSGEKEHFFQYSNKQLNSAFRDYWLFPLHLDATEQTEVVLSIQEVGPKLAHVSYILDFFKNNLKKNVSVTVLLPESKTNPTSLIDVSNALKPTDTSLLELYDIISCLRDDHKLSINSLLLVGFPGTGKTESAKFLAKHLQLPFYTLRLEETFNRLVGDSEKAFAAALNFVEGKDCVFFIDEFDKLFSNNGHDTTEKVKSMFLQWLTLPKKCFVILAANRVNKIPIELLRKGRIDKIKYCPLPTKEEKARIIAGFALTDEQQELILGNDFMSHAESASYARDLARKNAVQRMWPEKNITVLPPKPLALTRKEEYEYIKSWSEEYES